MCLIVSGCVCRLVGGLTCITLFQVVVQELLFGSNLQNEADICALQLEKDNLATQMLSVQQGSNCPATSFYAALLYQTCLVDS